MYRVFYLLILFISATVTSSVTFAQTDAARTSVIKIEGDGQFSRTDTDRSSNTNQQVVVAEGFSYYTSSGGIYLVFSRPNNNVRLFALTGQLIWGGELVSGRFFIQTGEGIYFLRVNNKSYKVSCK
jgi:hypothetical protein